MIGTVVTGTLFYIEWIHVKDPDATGTEPAMVKGEGYIVSADPSGADLYEISKTAILNGRAKPEHQFTLLMSKRTVEVKGRAIVSGGSN